MKELKAVGICGSLRKGSYNMKLLDLAIRYAQAAGHTIKKLDLNDYPMPLYNTDIELVGIPAEAVRLGKEIEAADVVFFAIPEHNHCMPAALKNAIDWLTRFKPSPFDGRIAGIFGASTGPLGSVRAQLQFRQSLLIMNMMILPQPQVMVGMAESAFEADGSLKIKPLDDMLRQLVSKTFDLAGTLRK